MNKFIKKLIFSIFTILIIAGFANSAFAVEDPKAIEFESTPLFGTSGTAELNFTPGNSVSRWVKFTNKTDITRHAYIRVAEVINSDNFGDAVNLVIKQGDTILYNDTFSNFFHKSKVELPQVKVGETNVINFIATFTPESTNNYQNKTMSFGLQAILEDVDETTDRTTNIGGFVIGAKNLIISDEVAENTGQTTGNITISWNTNLPATSQVIYGLASLSPYNLDLSLPNFGYPFSTIEKDLNKVTNHTVNITNLALGEYVYRVVSRASPATVSYEHHFTISDNIKTLALDDNKILGNNADQLTLGTTLTDETSTQEKTNLENKNLLGASVGEIMGIPSIWFWIIIVILMILILFIVRKKYFKKDK